MRGLLVFAVAALISGCLSARPATIDPEAILGGSLPDPAALGPLDVVRFEYNLGSMSVTEPRTMVVPFPSHLIGNVHYPDDDGVFPVVLFMHGRHATCGIAQRETLGPLVCPETLATYPVESYRGYDYLGEQLASHGYVVISASANNINDLDQFYGDSGATSRAQVVLRTLDEFQSFNKTAGPEPIGTKLVGKMDFSRVGLMGHSRGGEGVTRAITYNRDRTDGSPHHIRAVFALAPTDFSRWPAPDVAFATLLPYCDGDVSNLQGAWIYDDARYLMERAPSPKIQILALGSNHNYYNTIWTSNDGARFSQDPHCSAVPENQKGAFVFLGPEDQRRHGLVYMSAFFRAYVGDERAFLPLFSGTSDPPQSACPQGASACAGLIHVSHHAPAGQRLILEDTADRDALSRNDLGGPSTFSGFTNLTVCVPASCPTRPNYAAASQLVLGWDEPGAVANFSFLPTDVSAFNSFTFRVGVAGGDPRNEEDVPKTFRAMVRDVDGREAAVDLGPLTMALFEPPGRSAQKTTLNMVAVPLGAWAGVDLRQLVEVRFVFDGSPRGLVNLADLQWQNLPRAGPVLDVSAPQT
jgi:hypothetical protein